jgi:hypothetical protein
MNSGFIPDIFIAKEDTALGKISLGVNNSYFSVCSKVLSSWAMTAWIQEDGTLLENLGCQLMQPSAKRNRRWRLLN